MARSIIARIEAIEAQQAQHCEHRPPVVFVEHQDRAKAQDAAADVIFVLPPRGDDPEAA